MCKYIIPILKFMRRWEKSYNIRCPKLRNWTDTNPVPFSIEIKKDIHTDVSARSSRQDLTALLPLKNYSVDVVRTIPCRWVQVTFPSKQNKKDIQTDVFFWWARRDLTACLPLANIKVLMSTGHLHWDGFKSLLRSGKIKKTSKRMSFYLVGEAGLEPARPQWTLEPESSESTNSTTRPYIVK